MTAFPKALTPEEEQEAKDMVGTWFQISRRHRIVARFPPGVSPKDALRQAIAKENNGTYPPYREKWLALISEDSAGSHFLSVYTTYTPELSKSLSTSMFNAFRAAGGDTYEGHQFRKSR